MKSTNVSPEKLSERELFTEYIELLNQEPPDNGYQITKFNKRRAQLLAEIGERLEALEATKSLLKTTDIENNA